MPLAVLGMHRSGTSMITRMLGDVGMQLGPQQELLGPSHENPTGYWERVTIVLLNDRVLEHLGLAWDHMPHRLEAGWERSEDLAMLVNEARGAVASFPKDAPWGWKDPRTSITLPLWELASGLTTDVVLCVRNPIDVAISLHKRGATSSRLSFQLWHAYMDSALELARTRRHVVTHYDAYFEDAATEFARVCEAVGLDATPEQLRGAAERVDGTHRHATNGLAALVQSSAPDETVALYLELLALSGPVMATVAGRDAMVVEQDDSPVDRAETAEWVRQFRAEQGLAVSGRPAG